MRRDIDFKSEDGTTLRGWHYTPDQVRGKVPTIVMAHGFSAVKEMYLDRFAEDFAAAGLAAVVFDNRNFGASDGEPRQEIDLWQQIRDYRDAITFAETLETTDPDRIGIWGSSYSGGHVLVVVRSTGESNASCRRPPSYPVTPTLGDWSGRIASRDCIADLRRIVAPVTLAVHPR